MTPFIMQVTRLISCEAPQPLQLQCRTMAWYNIMCGGNPTIRRYRSAKDITTIPHQFLFVPRARIMSMNGQPIPQEWIIDDDLSENMMVVDVRWAETDFTIEEVD